MTTISVKYKVGPNATLPTDQPETDDDATLTEEASKRSLRLQ